MAEKQDKGNDFLTHSFLRNTAFAKQENVSAQNRNLGIFSTKGIKELFNITKELRNINKNLLTQKASSNKKDFVRREDTNLKLIKEVDDLEELMKENNKLQKKKSSGLLGMLGNIAKMGLVGGLVGYLLFGDNKYIKAARDMFKTVGGFIWDGIKWVGKWVGKKIKDWWDTGGDDFTFQIMNNIKDGLIEGVKGVWKWAKNNKTEAAIAGLLGFILTGNLGFLTSIVGGIAKVGVTLAAKGIGAAATTAAPVLGQTTSLLTSSAGLSMLSTVMAVALPIIGMAAAGYFANKYYLKKRSYEEQFKKGEFSIVDAETGTTIRDFGKPAYTEGHSVDEYNKQNITSRESAFKSNLASTKESISQASSWGSVGNPVFSLVEQNKLNKQSSASVFKDPDEIAPGIKRADSSVDINGLDPKVRENLFALGREYKANNPDKSIIINSGYRTWQKQYELYKKGRKGYVALPGTSPHERRYAVDIQTKGDEGFADWDLASNYGFHRPIPDKEPWHAEYGKNSNTSVDSEEGDPIIKNNLPRSTIERIMKGEQTVPIDLSEKTIGLLADALGMSMKGVMPKGQTPRVSFDTSMRS